MHFKERERERERGGDQLTGSTGEEEEELDSGLDGADSKMSSSLLFRWA